MKMEKTISYNRPSKIRKRTIWRDISKNYSIDIWDSNRNCRSVNKSFNEDDIKDIYYRSNNGGRGIMVKLSKEYNTSKQTIRDIKYKRRYKHILINL